MPKEIILFCILLGNINDNEEYDYFYCNNMGEGNVIKKFDKFEIF